MDLFGDMIDLDQGPVSTGPGRATRAVLFDEPGGVDLLGISDGGRKKVELVLLVVSWLFCCIGVVFVVVAGGCYVCCSCC